MEDTQSNNIILPNTQTDEIIMVNNQNIKLKPDEINVVIYHSPCLDGSASRYVAERYFKENNIQVEYYGMQINDPLPENFKNKNILVCDYSFSYSIIQNLLLNNNRILILDHHTTNEQELSTISECYKVFDKTKCGAYLTFKYFYPTLPVPKLIMYVQDHDLWQHKLNKTKEIKEYMFDNGGKTTIKSKSSGTF